MHKVFKTWHLEIKTFFDIILSSLMTSFWWRWFWMSSEIVDTQKEFREKCEIYDESSSNGKLDSKYYNSYFSMVGVWSMK